MKVKRRKTFRFIEAALVVLSAAICAVAQNQAAEPQHSNQRTAPPVIEKIKDNVGEVRYAYEFKQPEFFIRHILIEHDSAGHGQISFARKNEEQDLTEKLELSTEALVRITALWDALHFLESDTDYQSSKQFPHLGTYRLRMIRGTRDRTAEFNWTNDRSASALVNEYRRVADQALFIFDINLARETDPLEAPKILDRLDILLSRGSLSDPQQLVPLLRDLAIDERIPLIARNHATRLLKKIEK